METSVSSQHVRSAAELLLLIPIKPGFVPASELFSYSTRLRKLLEVLFELRRLATDRDLRELAGPVERLQTIHRVQWTVVDPQRRDEHSPAGQQLLVTAHFDRSWEDYFRLLVDITGPLLDMIFCHCVGYEEGLTCRDGYDRFAAWIRQHQLPCDFLFATAPEVTVDDVRYLKKLSTVGAASADALGQFTVASVLSEAQAANQGSSLELDKIIRALYTIRESMFSGADEFARAATPGAAAPRTGFQIFDNAVQALLLTEFDRNADFSGLPKPVLNWLATFLQSSPQRPARSSVTLDPQTLAGIQGNLLTGYQGMTHGLVVMLRCDDAAATQTLLRTLRPSISAEAAKAPDVTVNLALTYAGLETLSLEESLLSGFPQEFREGMDRRAGLLGDVGVNYPSLRGNPALNGSDPKATQTLALSMVDVVVMIQGRCQDATGDHLWSDQHPLRGQLLGLKLDSLPGVHILHVQPLRRFPVGNSGSSPNVVEHFGFAEGAVSSQPIPAAIFPDQDLTQAAAGDLVALGELLLGYPNERGEIAACANPDINPNGFQLFKDGTFMVMRKLQQDVAAFNDFVQTQAQEARAGTAPDLAALTNLKQLIMGRGQDGTPLVPVTSGKPNEYDFSSDPKGEKCPFHAHVRRANPRTGSREGDAPIPRILRRGFAYGTRFDADPTGQERGLMFMAYNASIAAQFEVIQRWLNGGNSTGILSNQSDLLFSTRKASPGPHWTQIDGKYRAIPAPADPLVSLKWGLYLFVPSLSAIDWLAARAQPQPDSPATRGRARIAQLDALSGTAKAADEWKRLLEEFDNRELAAEIWAAIREDGGFKDTPYGALVASAAGAAEVLGDPLHKFSVREYFRRLTATTAEHYLGFDPVPGHLASTDPKDRERDQAFEARVQPGVYEQLSRIPNQYLDSLTFAEGKELGFNGARSLLATPGAFDHEPRTSKRSAISVRDLARVVVGKVAQTWLGVPAMADDQALLELIERFVVTSRYAFQPYPAPWVEADSQAKGSTVPASYTALSGPMADYLRSNGYTNAADIRNAMIGAVVGFAAPAIGCIASVLDCLTESGELWRLADRVAVGGASLADKIVQAALLDALVNAPVPPLLYRTALDGAVVAGNHVTGDKRVIVGLGAACEDESRRNPSEPEPWKWLFGGDHSMTAGDGKPAHGCPARKAAIGVMVGVIEALLAQGDLRRESQGVLSYTHA